MKINATILSRVLAQPWAIRQEQLALFTQLVLSADEGGAPAVERDRIKPKAGYWPLSYEGAMAMHTGLPELPPDVTCILVWGILGRAWTDSEKFYFDAGDVDDLVRAIDAAPSSHTVVLWFRSPGGIITGIPEAAAALRKRGSSRRLLAFSDDLCASAAYWLASQCERIDATPTAELGSIGVYLAFYDFCQFLENAGIKLELFKAGRLKGMFLPGNPLDEEARSYLQAGTDEAYRLFKADVLRNRELDTETMQGQTFNGDAAQDRNLADGTQLSADEYFRALGKAKI